MQNACPLNLVCSTRNLPEDEWRILGAFLPTHLQYCNITAWFDRGGATDFRLLSTIYKVEIFWRASKKKLNVITRTFFEKKIWVLEAIAGWSRHLAPPLIGSKAYLSFWSPRLLLFPALGVSPGCHGSSPLLTEHLGRAQPTGFVLGHHHSLGFVHCLSYQGWCPPRDSSWAAPDTGCWLTTVH